MPKKTAATADKELSIPEQARACLEAFEDRESDNIQRAKEAILFRAGEQWPDAIRRDREDEGQDGGPRPCPVLDKTNQYVRQIINEERQNRAAIKIRPVDDEADPKTAEIYTGIIRHIEDQSEATVAYTTGGEQAIDGGFGYWRILTEYTDPMSFDQDILIKRIHNRFSVALGPHSESDASDVKEALVWEDMPREDFKKEYPNAKEIGFEGTGEWADKDTVRVAEYFRIEQTPETIVLLDDGSTQPKKRYDEAKPAAEAEGIMVPEVIKQRETLINTVKWYKITSEDVLEEKTLVGTYIPIVKVTGNEITLPDGKIRVWGAIDEAMDPQRLHNFSHAGYIEHVALAPRAPWVAEEGQVENYENEYADANRKAISVLKYKGIAIDGHILPAPQRTPPAGIPPGWDKMLQNTEHGVEAAFGMYGPSVGAQSQEKSGIALREQKAQGMVGNFHFPDNLSRSIQQTGRILLEWIPHYYDTERVARILGEDGEEELVYLNPDQEKAAMPRQDEMGKEDGFVYNLNVGKYDVTVSTGPSYTAKRQEAAEMQLQVIQAAPELMPVMGDILFKNMDAPGSDEIAERLKTMLPPEIKKLEADKDKGTDPKVQAAMAQVEQAAQMIEQKGQQLAEIEAKMQQKATEIGADESQMKAAKAELEAQKKVFMAEAKAQRSELELLGRRLIDEIEDSTDPIMEQLKSQTERPESEEGEEEMEETSPMAELMEQITMMNAHAQAQMAETVSNALITVTEIVSAPRQTTIINDANGDPTGSISKPILNS